MLKQLLMFIGLLLASNLANAQDEVKPNLDDFQLKAAFVEDSLGLGTSCFYTLSLYYPKDWQVLFPDTTYSFAPFELIDRQYFNTETQDNLSHDSVVYQLTSYEILPYQRLRLPVFIVVAKDCTTVYSPSDSIVFKPLVPKDGLKVNALKASNEYEEVKSYFNFPYLITSVLVLLTLGLIVWGVLGKQIQQNYRLFQFRTRHAIFIKEFGRLTTRSATKSIEQALFIWKKHLEYIENQPFSSYTTKEIIQIASDEQLGKSLKNIDRSIYGQEISSDIKTSFDVLLKFAIQRFEYRKEKLRDG